MYNKDVGDIFPEIPEGVAVRALLKHEDLVLMRKVFVWYGMYNEGARHNLYNNDVARLQMLMKRMLRKGGSGCYSRRKSYEGE